MTSRELCTVERTAHPTNKVQCTAERTTQLTRKEQGTAERTAGDQADIAADSERKSVRNGGKTQHVARRAVAAAALTTLNLLTLPVKKLNVSLKVKTKQTINFLPYILYFKTSFGSP
jgi:hypothetical protein